MKSFFTKLGGLLLCGVMFTAVGCHDYAEDIKDVNDRLDKIDGVLSGDSEGVAKDLAALKATVAALDATYATEAELEKAVGDLQKEIEGDIAAALTEATTAIEGLQKAVADKADKSELEAAETEFAAKIGELRTAMETAQTKMEAALAGLDAKYVALSVYNAEISKINAALAGLGETYLTKEDFNSAKAAIETTLGALDTKVKAVEGSIETLEETLASKADKTEVEVAIATAVQVVADKVSALETTVGDLNTKLGEAQEAIKNNADAIDEVKGNLATEVSELEAAIALKADKTAVETLDTELKKLVGTVDDIETALEGKADASALTDAVVELQKAIAEKADASALEAAVVKLEGAISAKADASALEAAVAGLQGSIDALAKENKEAHESLQDYTAAVKAELRKSVESLNEEVQKLHNQISELQAELKKLASSSNVSEAEIAQLFARIQSVVLRPDNKDGKVYVTYAKAGNTTLEGYSEVTYKVFPAECAKTIADAINATENPALTVSFDAYAVTKSANTELLKVVSADADVDGCLTLQYKANLGADFYTSTTGYNAALVLAETREDNPQIFSTEYANFVSATPKEYKMVPYLDGKEFVAGAADASWMFVEVGKTFTKDILANLEPRFQEVVVAGDAPAALTAEEFAELGYDAEYKVVSTATYAQDLPEQTISVAIAEDASVKACLIPAASNGNIGQTATVTKTLAWVAANQAVNVDATLSVVEFPYVLKVNSPAHKKVYAIEYTDFDKEVKVLGDDDAVELVFVNTEDETDVVPADEMIAEYPAIEIKSRYDVLNAMPNSVSSFTYEPASDDYPYPVTVKLAESVTKDNVADQVRMRYWFYAPVLGDNGEGTYDTYAYVKINPETHYFSLADDTRNWNYKEDAAVDAAIYNKAAEGNKYIYSNEIALAEGAETEDIKLSELLATAKYYFGAIEEDSVPVEGVKFSKAADAENVKVEFTGFDWGKTYNVIAYSELPSGKTKTDENGNEISVPAAVIYVYFDLTTVDRNRDAVTYTAKEAVKIPFAKDLVMVTEDAYSLAGLYENLVEAGNLNADAEAQADYLKNLVVVNNTIVFVDVNTEITFQNGSFLHSHIVTDAELLAENSYKVAYNANAQIKKGNELFKNLTDVLTARTWYGQEVLIKQDVELVDPKYDFAAVPQYIKGEDNAYYIDVLPEYGYDANGIMTSFSTKKVNLNGAFDVVDAEGNVLSAEKMAELGINRVYSMVGNTDTGITFDPAYADNSVIVYNGKAEAVNVNGALYILNTNGTKYAIDETIFTGTFKSFEVRKFDPLADMTVLDGKAEQQISINEAKVYNFAVLDNYSLEDVLGNELINSANVAAAQNDFLHNYASAAVYGLVPSYSMTAYIDGAEVALPTGISFSNGVITVDNTAQIQFANPVTVVVSATITYPQGERVGETVTYTFN